MKWLLVAATLLLAWSGSEARACKLAWSTLFDLHVPAAPVDTVGPLPLLTTAFSNNGATLTDAAGNPIVVVPFPGLQTVDQDGNTPMFVFRPAVPLPSGEYHWQGLAEPRTFFVDATLPPEVPPTLSDTHFEVVIDRHDSTSGCGSTSCDGVDLSRLLVTFTSDVADPWVRLEIDSDAFSRVFFGGLRGQEHIFESLNHAVGGDLRKDRFCIALTPVATDGTFGTRIDLGCSNPNTGANVDDRDGCASTDTTNIWAVLMALLALVYRRTRNPLQGTP